MRVIFQINYEDENSPSDIEVHEISSVSLGEKIDTEDGEHAFVISFGSNDESFEFSFDTYEEPYSLVRKAYETGMLDLTPYELSNYIVYADDEEEEE